MRTGIVDMPI